MKLILLHQIANPQEFPFLVSELWLNRDIIRWAHLSQNIKRTATFTKLTLIADDKELNILETPQQINNLCNFVQEIEIVGDRKINRKPSPKDH